MNKLYSVVVFLLLGFFSSVSAKELACPPKTKTISAEICKGSSFYFSDSVIFDAGTYKDTVVLSTGCDSITTLQLSIIKVGQGSITKTVCIGDSVYWGKVYHKTAGVYYDTTTNYLGCDSITKLTLDFKTQPVKDTTVSICKGKRVTINSKFYTIAGDYNIHVKRASGCDSIINLHLTVNPTYQSNLEATKCMGESYSFFGTSITKSGIYNKIFATKEGCDSTITLNVTFNLRPSKPTVTKKGIDSLMTNLLADKYLWFRDSHLDTTLKGQSIKAKVSGSYSLVLQTTNCSSDSSDKVDVNLVITGSLENELAPDQISIFPNPNKGEFYINLTKPELVTVYDLIGNKISELNLPEGRTFVNLSNAPKGTFIVKTNSKKVLININY